MRWPALPFVRVLFSGRVPLNLFSAREPQFLFSVGEPLIERYFPESPNSNSEWESAL
jgi:hypothetical protein